MRGGSVDLPKSKFLIGGAVPPIMPRSGSAGRRAAAAAAQTTAPAHGHSPATSGAAGKTNVPSGVRSVGDRQISPKSTNLRLPILALGRSDSMALYTDVVDDEARLAEAAQSSAALNTQVPPPPTKERSPRTTKDGSPKKEKGHKTTKTAGSPAANGAVTVTQSRPGGDLLVGMQRTDTVESDFGLLLYDEDDPRNSEGTPLTVYACWLSVVCVVRALWTDSR